MPVVLIQEGESFEGALRRFKQQCERTGVFSEIKRREYFEKPSVKRKQKMMAVRKRAVIKRLRRIAANALY